MSFRMAKATPASRALLCLWPAAPEEGVAGTHLLQLTLFRESGLAESSSVCLVARQFPSDKHRPPFLPVAPLDHMLINNVRALLDNTRSNRPERRMALVAWELAQYTVDIAALSETQYSELEEVGIGYTFFWSGGPNAERRDAGVSFAIQNDIVGLLSCLPQGINGLLMNLLLPLRGDNFATIISAYAPQ
ncbi:unnamed protein product [Schistocephalus solidus]|uniref:Uncharacterized protein n=1 Tax=Schistocephalus solidus TaxID=70667 RepID=A0A183TCU5_SCHSO|nr:unnamed protein product [Schistocephalus solidus]